MSLLRNTIVFFACMLALEVVLLGFAGFSESSIEEILVLSYYVVALIVFIIGGLCKLIFCLFYDWSLLIPLASDIFIALMLILAIIFINMFDVFIDVMLAWLRLFGDDVFEQVRDLLKSIMPEVSINVSEKLSGFYQQHFGIAPNMPYELEIVAGGGALYKVINKLFELTEEAIDDFIDDVTTLNLDDFTLASPAGGIEGYELSAANDDT